MQKYGMPIHKFITKHERQPPAPIKWLPHENLKHSAKPLTGKWEIFTQQTIAIQPRVACTISLKMGVRLIRGVCIVSLRQSLKEKQCSLQDGFVAESVDDIIVTIQNNSDTEVNINEDESLCFVSHQSN
jgi:hypothetical protein